MHHVLIFISALFFHEASVAHQNPNWVDPLMNDLESETATVMDLGFLRAEMKLKPVAEYLKLSASVTMLFERGQFGVALEGWAWDEDKTKEDAKLKCRSFIDRVRLVGSIDKNTGGPLNETSQWAGLFNHVAYQKAELVSANKALDQRIQIRCHAKYVEGQKLLMTAPLLGKQVFIVE